MRETPGQINPSQVERDGTPRLCNDIDCVHLTNPHHSTPTLVDRNVYHRPKRPSAINVELKKNAERRLGSSELRSMGKAR